MRHKWLIGAVALALIAALPLSVHVLARGIRGVESFAQAAESASFGVVWAINALVLIAFGLFVAQTGRETLRVLGTVALALLIGGLILLILSPQRAADAYAALLSGPLSRLNRWATWIDDAISLTLVALAISLVFKANLFSLGAEGQIFLGALASGLVALFVEGLPTALHLSLAVGAGALVGLLWGLIPALLRAYLGANELVATLMLNPIAALLYGFVLERIRLPQSGIIASAFFPETALLPRLIPATRVTTAVLWALIAALAVWWLMTRTPFGYALRAMGANPSFARYGGIRLEGVIVGAMALSGLLSGLAGSYLALGIYQRLPLAVSSGLTFEAIVAALLARNNPLAVPAMALLYSYLRVGAPIMQNDAAVSLEIVRIIQALIILLFTAEGLLSLWARRRAVAAWKAS